MPIKYDETAYGFEYGAAAVERVCADEKKGWVVISVKTPKCELEVYVTKTGKVRIHDKSGVVYPPNTEVSR